MSSRTVVLVAIAAFTLVAAQNTTTDTPTPTITTTQTPTPIPTNNTRNGTDITLTPANIALGVILPQIAGVLNAIFISCIPLLTNTLQKFTLWSFENVWLPFSLFAFFVFPVVSFFGIVPISMMAAYVNSTFDVLDWIAPCFLIGFFVILGISFYAWAVSLSGVGIASLFVFGLFPIVATFVSWGKDGSIVVRYLGSDTVSIAPAIVFTIGAGIILIGLVLSFVATIFAEKHHRYKRAEILQGILQDAAKDTERLSADSPKDVDTISETRVAITYWIGIVMAIVSGLCFFLVSLGTYVTPALPLKLMNNGGMSYFQAKVSITTIGLSMGSIPAMGLAIGLLLAKRSIFQYAIASGGAVACIHCNNFKWIRLVGLGASITVSILWYYSFLMMLFAETQLTAPAHQATMVGLPNMQYGLYALWTVILTSIFSGLFGEYKSTKTPERVMMPISVVIVVIGLILVSYGGYAADKM